MQSLWGLGGRFPALGRDGGDIARVRTHEAHAFRLRAIVLSRDAMLRAFLAFQVERIKCIRHPRIGTHKQIDLLSICHGVTFLVFELCRAFHIMLRCKSLRQCQQVAKLFLAHLARRLPENNKTVAL